MRINRTLFLTAVALGLASCVALAASASTSLRRGSWTKKRYAIPGEADLGDFRSLIIHCEKYSKVWGGARLAPETR